MENIINFLNVNNGALMVIITAVYVVATIQICRANIKSAKASNAQVAAAKEQTDAVKAQLDESKREYEETKRLQMMPYFEIIVHDDIRDFVECIELTISNSNAENSTVIDRRISIKNIGLGVAKDFTYTWCNLDGVIRGTTLVLQHLLREKKKASTLIFMPNVTQTLVNMRLLYP